MDSAGFHHAAVRAARLLLHKKHRQQRRCFLVEGPQLVDAALRSGAAIEHVFISGEEQAAPALVPQHALAGLPADARIFRVDHRTLDSLSQTKTPQGIAAVVGFVHREVGEIKNLEPTGGPAGALVLHDLSDPGNAGTLVRSAEAFGASMVCFGPRAVEPYNDKVVRASMGSLFRVPIVRYERWAELVAGLRAAGFAVVAADAGGRDVRAVTFPMRAAIVVGQERHGLDAVEARDLDLIASVAQRPGVDSLNAGVAGSLVLYEFARALGLVGEGRG